MEVVLFMGIPASGKSTFYKQRFADTHVRINRDMLKTKNREKRLFEFCISTEQPCVIDNTNVSIAVRKPFIQAAQEADMPVFGYFFQSKKRDCLARNEARSGDAKLPNVAIHAKVNNLELPTRDEGFTEMYFVKLVNGGFEVSDWE